MSLPLLFTPTELRSVSLRNRIVISPMCQYSAENGQVTDWHLVHLGKFAQGGAGVVFVEATAVESRGRITHGDTGLWDDAQVPGLKRIADFLRSQGAVPAIQLAHAGRKASMARPWYGNGPLTQEDFRRGDLAWPTVAASAVPVDDKWQRPQSMTRADLQAVRDAFRDATRRAVAAGFDIVEVHAAHGYLLHSFLSPLANFRDDEYGGDRAGRMRFPLEIATIVREALPNDKPMFFRCSAIDDYDNGWTLDDTVEMATQLGRIGVDVIDCSSGGIYDSATGAAKKMPRSPRTPGFQVGFAERIRQQTTVKTMAVGLILGANQASAILDEGRADLVAIAREALYDPSWPIHAAQELGIDPDFERWPQQYGWWLTRRESLLRKQGIRRQHGVAAAG